MNNNAQAMVLASLTADALALGAHWIYDVEEIDRKIGIIDEFISPQEGSYHSQRVKGEFTHYGDQTLLLLQSISDNQGFDLSAFARDWQSFFRSYDGYIDHATRLTLQNMVAGKALHECGSGSSDLGGPARIAPLVYCYRDNLEQLLATAHEQTAMTHTGTAVRAGTDFIARTAQAVLLGSSPATAIDRVLEDGVADIDLDLRLRKSLDTVATDTRQVIKEFGQMCGISAALPGAVHLILAYQDDLREALIQNVMAGGDSAARGLVVGMILGAHLGMDAVPQQWLTELKAHDTIMHCLARIP